MSAREPDWEQIVGGPGRLGPADRQVLERAAAGFTPQIGAIALAVGAGIAREHRDLVPAGDDVVNAAVVDATHANIGAIVSTLTWAVAPDQLEVPDGALAILDHLAREADALPEMLRMYRLGAAGFLQAWLAHLARQTSDAAQLDRLVRASADHVAGYVDRISELIVRRWTTVVQTAALADRRRDATVRALLAGERVDPVDLDHPVDRAQVVLALRSAAADGPTTAAVVRRLAAVMGDPPALTHEPAPGTVLAWLAPVRPADPAAVRSLVAAVPPGVWCAVAPAIPGLGGLSEGAENVREALGVLQRTHPGGHAAEHADVALVGTLLSDQPRAHRFLRAVLGELADDTARSRQLRETLRAYDQAGGRKSGAAAILGLHEKTVAYRLRNAEASLGGPERAYRADVNAALLLHSVLGASVAGPPEP
ncbi:helix-turn-helix domain-containing protein [Paraconexibacter sp. AEG42_29]|uniref:PucR family transcriptional regulator n=1 Tax=Paraconexibacter sp. AEG42_29 TaxID=2997339 RepID=UPI00339D841B